MSDSPKVIDSLFFNSSPIFSNPQISPILLVFLDRIDVLLLKYDMMISFSVNLSGFRIFMDFSGFPRFFQIFSVLTIFLYRRFSLLERYDMMISLPGNLSSFWIFSRFIRNFFNFQTSVFLTIFLLEIFEILILI